MSTNGRSWFEGTMEVISGMAPRPSTPQPYQARSMSAPNSPARANFPAINRLPSQDSLDRSIHNESGHGKSTAQIIRDLKAANCALSAKSASMEAQFMNQLSEVTKSFEERQKLLEETVKKRDKQIAALEAWKVGNNSKIQDKDAQLAKIKEESAFQRHTISDLKNQLYQLQADMEESEYEKRDEVDRWEIEKEEMTRDMEHLARQAEEGLRYKEQVEELQIQLENALQAAKNNNNNNSSVSNRPPRPSNDKEHDCWKKLEETQGELERQTKRLSITQVDLKNIQAEKENLAMEHHRRVSELEGVLQSSNEEWKMREHDLRTQIENMEGSDSRVTEDLRMQLDERDDTIAELRDELQKYADQVADLSNAIAHVRQDAVSQEQYRRDEVEDLRILHDAQEEEIERLRKEVDDVRRELELRDEEMEEKDKETTETIKRVERRESDLQTDLDDMQKEIEHYKNELEMLEQELYDKEKSLKAMERSLASAEKERDSIDDAADANEVQKQILHYKEELKQLRQELDERGAEHQEHIEALQNSIDALTEQNNSFQHLIETLGEERDDAVSKVENIENAKQAALNEVNSTQEIVREMSIKLAATVEAEKAATAKVESLVKELDQLRTTSAANKEEIESLKSQLDEAEQKVLTSPSEDELELLQESREEVKRLKESLKSLEADNEDSVKVKKQLREAQIALVALDDEKRQVVTEQREVLSAAEKKKVEMKKEFEEKIVLLEQEIVDLKKLGDKASLVEGLESQVKEFESQMKEFAAEASQLSVKNRELLQIQARLENEVEDEKTKSSEELKKLRKELQATREMGKTQVAKIKTKDQDKDVQIKKLKDKLKDRDTTISALVRSSVSLESKISTMETELEELRAGNDNSQMEQELKQTRVLIEKFKQKERGMLDDISALQRDLESAQLDADRWRSALESDGSTSAEYRFQISSLKKELDDYAERLHESDVAIANLVDQSMNQEALVNDLKAKLAALSGKNEPHRKGDDKAVRAEIFRLKRESEIFAGQIIEQDEELEALKHTLHDRDAEVENLRKEVTELKNKISNLEKCHNKELETLQTKEQQRSTIGGSSDSWRVTELQAELDELQEANETNKSELRDLRKRLREAAASAGAANDLRNELAQAKYALEEYKRKSEHTMAAARLESRNEYDELKRKFEASGSFHNEALRDELAEAIAKNKALEERMAQQVETLRRLKNEAVETLEAKVRSRDATVEKLQQQLAGSGDSAKAVEDLKQELEMKTKALEEATATQARLRVALNDAEKAKEQLEREVSETFHDVPTGDNAADTKELREEIESLRRQLDTVKRDRDVLEELKAQLETEKDSRESAEKSIIASYERQMSLLTLNKDVTIDNLRKELADSRGKNSEDQDEMMKHMAMIETENKGLRDQLQIELQEKNNQIYALEHTLNAQEQVVESMRIEMDQLQSGMEHATQTRRGEVEEMQKEVIELESRAMKQEREITALNMRLKESQLEHQAEIVKLRDTIVSMEKESPLAKKVAELQHDDRMLEVRERLEQLKWRNTSLQEENLKLGGRLERAEIQIRAAEAERMHSAELEKEVDRLQRQVKQLELVLAHASKQQRQMSSPPPTQQHYQSQQQQQYSHQQQANNNNLPPANPAMYDKENKKDKKLKRNMAGSSPRKLTSSGSFSKFFKRKPQDATSSSSPAPPEDRPKN